MNTKNTFVAVGTVSALNLYTYKLGLRGYMTVAGRKLRVDMRKLSGNGELWAGYDAQTKVLSESEGKRVIISGYVQDGSYANEAGDIYTGNQFVVSKCRPVPADVDAGEDRIIVVANMRKIGDDLYYAKNTGHGCLKWFGKVADQVGVVPNELQSMTLRLVRKLDDFGYERQYFVIVDVNDAVADEYGMFTMDDVAAYPALRDAYEVTLRQRQREQAAHRAH